MKKSFDPSKLSIKRTGEFASEWTMAKERVHGEVLVFEVIDRNIRDDNAWTFFIQIPNPKSRDENVIVRPEVAPSRDDLAAVERRAVTFMPTDKGLNAGKRYCKVNLADPSGERTKIGVRHDERSALPAWMSMFESRMRKKESIKDTRGKDGQALVVLFNDDDYEGMIRLFFATRVWPLMAGFSMGD